MFKFNSYVGISKPRPGRDRAHIVPNKSKTSTGRAAMCKNKITLSSFITAFEQCSQSCVSVRLSAELPSSSCSRENNISNAISSGGSGGVGERKNRIYKMHAKLFKSGRIMTDCLLHARLNVYVRTYLVVCAWHYSVWKTRVCRLSARSMAMPVVVIVYLGFTLY